MSNVDHGSKHAWTGRSPRTVRCAYMFCQARPSEADIERVRHDLEAARALRVELDWSTRRSAIRQ